MASFIRKYRREIFAVSLEVLVGIMLIPVVTYAYFANDLKTKEAVMNRNNTGVVLLDRKDRPFFTFYQAKNKTNVPLQEIPLHVRQAVIAMEDKDFYQHPGFSFTGILRSLIADIRERDMAYGGSTITQQLIKSSMLSPEKSVVRKIKEIVLAQEIERRYTKDEILEMYLNSVYFGEGAFGIEEAAQRYFSKHAKQLTVAEASLLAGILPSPSVLSPLSGGLKEAKIRQELVIDRMMSEKYLTPEQAAITKKTQLTFTPSGQNINNYAPHFALMVRDELIKKYGEEQISRSGFKVKTSLDLDWQKQAEAEVRRQVQALSYQNVTNGAVVVSDPKTGEIRALVGSRDWFNDTYGKYNIATAERQPGSAMKPLIYAAAFEKRLITPATLLRDDKTTFQGNYAPQNYDKKFRGRVTARRALANSLNVPAVDVMARVGLDDAMEMTKRLGITTLKDPSQYGLSFVLGTATLRLVELTNAYATFANEGERNQITTILAIRDKAGNTIYTYKPNPQRVLEREVAFLVSSILSDNNARSEIFGSTLTISRPAAVKTGTTENYKDAWTVGYTPDIAIGVWVGNNDGQVMSQVAGSLGAAPIWRNLMEQFSKGTVVKNFAPPAGIVTVAGCAPRVNASEKNPSYTYNEYVISGTGRTQPCPAPRRTVDAFSSNRLRRIFPRQEGIESKPQPTGNPNTQIHPTLPTQNEIKDISKEVKEQLKEDIKEAQKRFEDKEKEED
jgi:1A family penicillin-binding protein